LDTIYSDFVGATISVAYC